MAKFSDFPRKFDVRKLGLFLAVLIAAPFLGSEGVKFYVNSQLADPVNLDAEYPEEAFRYLEPEIRRVEGEDIRQLGRNRLDKRRKIAGVGAWDAAVTGAYVLDSGNSSASYVGSVATVGQCRTPGVEVTRCKDGKYLGTYSILYKGWLKRLTKEGGLERLYTNDTVRNRFTNYTRRAEFYDSYLDPEGSAKRPIESAHYASPSGLYLVGYGEAPLYVDGSRVEHEKRGTLIHSDIQLEPGHHRIRRANFSLVLPVHSPLPSYRYLAENMTFTVGPSGNSSFDTAAVYGGNWSRTMELDPENKTGFKAPVRLETIEFRRDSFSVNKSIGQENDPRPHYGLVYGMTKQEYRQFSWIQQKLYTITGQKPFKEG